MLISRRGKNMIKFRRLLSICLVTVLTGAFSIPAYASADNPTEPEEVCITTTEAERDAAFEKAMGEILEKIEKDNAVTRGPQYHYKTEYKSYKYTTLSGYAGNQVAGGYKFPTGGGFWFTDSGGPSVSGSVSVGLPKPFDMVSVSINLGQKGSSGLWVSVPSSSYYYKLYVSKKMELRPYVTYRARVGTENWEVWAGGAVPVVYSVSASAKKV